MDDLIFLIKNGRTVMKNEIIIGDCADVLKSLDSESIDCIVTDPPYGYSFMGLEWDKALPSLEALKECCRVLKPGAFGFFMCAPRMDVLWRMGQRLEEAGFRVDFSFIGWAFASGFPKSMSISKAIDKRGGAKLGEFATLIKKRREELGLTLKDVAKHFPSKTGGLTGCVWNWENGANVPTIEEYNKLIKILKLEGFPELAKAEREVIGKQKRKGNIGYENADYAFKPNERFITAPATDKAREFSGAFAGFQPKPALECIITVMKSLSEKTYVDQALQNGHGCTWLENCKIPYAVNDDERIGKDYKHNAKAGLENGNHKNNSDGKILNLHSPDGRFPANLLVSDNCLDRGIITNNWRPSDKIQAKQPLSDGTFLSETASSKIKNNYSYNRPKDSGDFSRYFSLDAWFTKKLSELPEEQQKTFPFLITPKPSKSEKNKYIENKHPTVKPLKLMSYLITLGSREGDVVLDPFAGSGTTLEAARLLNRWFIGIDKDESNKPLMEARGQLNTQTLSAY